MEAGRFFVVALTVLGISSGMVACAKDHKKVASTTNEGNQRNANSDRMTHDLYSQYLLNLDPNDNLSRDTFRRNAQDWNWQRYSADERRRVRIELVAFIDNAVWLIKIEKSRNVQMRDGDRHRTSRRLENARQYLASLDNYENDDRGSRERRGGDIRPSPRRGHYRGSR